MAAIDISVKKGGENGKNSEDEQLKLLRVLVNLADNKRCFDCGQPGPTYVNVTIGAYVCTACSGRLRGLSPPHRLKSITMATFTSEEMEFLKCRGNEFCRQVWLARRQDGIGGMVSDYDGDKMAAHLCEKYERQRWYRAPTEALYEEARRQTDLALEALKHSGMRKTGCGGGTGAVRTSSTMPDMSSAACSSSSGPTNELAGTPLYTTIKRPPSVLSPVSPRLPPCPSLPPMVEPLFSAPAIGVSPESLQLAATVRQRSRNMSQPSTTTWSPNPASTASPWFPSNTSSPWSSNTPSWLPNNSSSSQQPVQTAAAVYQISVADFADFEAAQRHLAPPNSSSGHVGQSVASQMMAGAESSRIVPPVSQDKYAALIEPDTANTPTIINWTGAELAPVSSSAMTHHSSTQYNQPGHVSTGYNGIAEAQWCAYPTATAARTNCTAVYGRVPCDSVTVPYGDTIPYNQQLNPFMNCVPQHHYSTTNPFL